MEYSDLELVHEIKTEMKMQWNYWCAAIIPRLSDMFYKSSNPSMMPMM